MIKSFLNYPGGKYRLLNQILPLFPDTCRNFVDLFTGSSVVAVNMGLDVPIKAFDNNIQLINLLKYVQKTETNDLVLSVESIIDKFELSNSKLYGYSHYNVNSTMGLASVNKKRYLKLRSEFNDLRHDDDEAALMLYVLVVFGFNNQIRFNRKGLFNNPVGKRDFNTKMKQKLIEFSLRVKHMEINFIHSDFRVVPTDLFNCLYYVDPPYLITTAVYNENGGWTQNDELDLLNILDEINLMGNKFALSNVFELKGRTNDILIEWSKRYNTHHLNMTYNNSNYQTNKLGTTDEVLITNY